MSSGGPAVEIGKMLQDEDRAPVGGSLKGQLTKCKFPPKCCLATLVSPGVKINSGVS